MSIGTQESGTAQCHLLLRSNTWSLDSHSSNTPGEHLRGIQTMPETVLPLYPIYSAYKKQDGNWWDLGHIYISELEQQPTTSQPTAKFNY